MEINNKDIWSENKKYCIICEEDCIRNGIEIMGYFICEKCVNDINLSDVNDDKYEILKKKITDTIAKKILSIEDEEER